MAVVQDSMFPDIAPPTEDLRPVWPCCVEGCKRTSPARWSKDDNKYRRQRCGECNRIAARMKTGVTYEEASIVPPEDNRCEICLVETDRLQWDHCHESKRFRAWLCSDCNGGQMSWIDQKRGLGFSDDDLRLMLERALNLKPRGT